MELDFPCSGFTINPIQIDNHFPYPLLDTCISAAFGKFFIPQDFVVEVVCPLKQYLVLIQL